MRMARAQSRRARCWSRCCWSCSPRRSSPEPCSGSAARIRRSTGAPELIRPSPAPTRSSRPIPAGSMSPATARPPIRPAPARTPTRRSTSASCRRKWPRLPAEPAAAGAAAEENPAQRDQGARAATRPRPPPRRPGPTIQLGAYASTIKAETAWKLLSGRFPQVAALNKIGRDRNRRRQVDLRLRAVGLIRADPGGLRGAEAAGESCLSVQLMQAAIYGLPGPELTAEERDFLPRCRPAGYILFKRNIEIAEQLRTLDRRAARPRGP